MARPPSIPPLVPPGARFAFGESPFRAKGVLYLRTQSFFDANVHGGSKALVDEIREPDLAQFISQKFLPSGWYDVMPVPALIAYEARVLRMTLDEYLLHRTRWQAKSDLGGLYGWVLKIASPGAVFSRLPKVFSQMFDFATVVTPTIEGKTARGAICGIPQELGTWLTAGFTVYTETALKLAGAHAVDVKITRDSDGTREGVSLIRLGAEATWA